MFALTDFRCITDSLLCFGMQVPMSGMLRCGVVRLQSHIRPSAALVLATHNRCSLNQAVAKMEQLGNLVAATSSTASKGICARGQSTPNTPLFVCTVFSVFLPCVGLGLARDHPRVHFAQIFGMVPQTRFTSASSVKAL